MKSFNLHYPIKRKLVTLIMIISMAFSTSFLSFSNPIIPPSMITEIYFGQWSWEIELHKNIYYEIEDLDSLWLYGLYDSAKFEYGHEFYGNTMVVTNYDMLTSMYIDQSGDEIELYYKNGNYGYPVGGISWGSMSSEASAPQGMESIAFQWFTVPGYYDDSWALWAVKELPHTIGTSVWTVSKRGTFSGYVRDKNDQPLSGIMLDYCYDMDYYYYTDPTVPAVYTDSTGYFYEDDMYCKKYHINFRNNDLGILGDTNICVEPDSANYFEFKLDTMLTNIKEIQSSTLQTSIFTVPNPSFSKTTFVIETSHPQPGTKAVIKIYSETGYIVDIIPVEIKAEKEEIIYNFSDKSLSQGVYLYSLELRNHKVASGKMIIQ